MLWQHLGPTLLGLSHSLTRGILFKPGPDLPRQPPSGSLYSRAVPDQIITPEVDDFIAKLLNDWSVPGGLSLSVVHQVDDGQWVDEHKGYGMAKIDGTPVTEDTLFAIGSNSKLFTALAVGSLIGSSNTTSASPLAWDTKMSSIFPEWAELPDSVLAEKGTILDLLSHRTGYPRHDLAPKTTDASIQTIGRLKNLQMSAEPRWAWQYNNMMYTVLSAIPQQVAQQSFPSFIQQRFLNPLGMTSTTYSYSKAQASGVLADGFTKNDFDPASDPFAENGTVRIYPYWNQMENEDNGYFGPGGIISSAQDMRTWMKMLLLNGAHPESGQFVVDPEVLQLISSGIMVDGPVGSLPELGPSVYGGGQGRSTYRGVEHVSHGGATPGFSTIVLRVPSLNVGITVFVNDDVVGSFVYWCIIYGLLDRILGLEPIDWSSRFRAIYGPQDNASPSTPPPPESSETTNGTSLRAFAGKYHDDGYGTVELCLIPTASLMDNDSSDLDVDEASPSAHCRQVIRELNMTLPGVWEGTQGAPTLIGEYHDNVWITHLLLSHSQGGIFSANGLISVRNPLNETSDDEYWAKLVPAPGAYAEFVVDDNHRGSTGVEGFALWGVWGASNGVGIGPRQQDGETLEERAEIWFKRV